MLRQLRPALVALACFAILTGLVYPLVVTGVAELAFADQADGSLVELDGQVRGSELIAQPFEGDEWFHPRPSAVDHSATTSGGSNLAPSSAELLDLVAARADVYRATNMLGDDVLVPIDAVTASGSGLDPHISPRNATLQASRVAAARDLDLTRVLDLVGAHTEPRTWAVLGEPRVNVVTLNAALEQLQG
jgi:K+-transporting ATPase ATPase C chain